MRKLPTLYSDHMCFGAGPANTKGLRMEFFTDDEKVYSNLTVPLYMNSWEGIVHGGIVSTILDETMFFSALCFFKCVALTKEVTVKLHKPARMDQMPFTAVGQIKERVNDTNGVICAGLYNAKGEICAESTGVFGLIKDHIIGKMGILTEKDIDMIKEVIKKI